MPQSTIAPTDPPSGLREEGLPPSRPIKASSVRTLSNSTFKESLLYNVLLPLLLLAVGALVLYLLGTVQTPQRPGADTTREGRLRALMPVRVERLQTLQSTGLPLYLTVDGTVVPYREARLAAEVAGRIVYKADECEPGSYVSRDQLLMRIDPTDHELEVQRLSRLREQEYQAIQEVDQELANTQRLIEVAQQDVVLQRREVDRQLALPEGFTSRAEIDQANRALLAATQQLVMMENQLESHRKRRVRLEASERLAATQLQAAEVNLVRTEIRAPIDGVIVSEEADLNTFVSRGSALVTIEDTSKVEVSTSLRMDQLYWVLNQQVEVPDLASRSYRLPETPARIEYEVTGREGAVYRWQGRLQSYDGIGLDPTTRMVPVRVVVDDPTAFIDQEGKRQKVRGATPLVRGMYVRVRLLITPQSNLIVIPSVALQPGNRIYEFVPDDSVLEGDVEPESADRASEAQAATRAVSKGNAAVDEQRSPFDPDRWLPGRVVIRKSVHPIDVLSLGDAAPRARSSVIQAAQPKYWVCEVLDAELSDDSFVVVSPIGLVDEETFSVRADLLELGPVSRELKHSSTSDSTGGNGEDT